MNQMARENQRWELAEKEAELQRQKQDYHREVLQAGKRNKNGVAYNPITLQYEDSHEGAALQQRDDQSKVRELIRQGNLDSRSNCGYNVITGTSPPPVS